MSLQCTPKHYFHNGDPKTIATSDDMGVWLECEMTHPRSSEGKTVYVMFSPEDVDKLLLKFRSNAIARRRQGMRDPV